MFIYSTLHTTFTSADIFLPVLLFLLLFLNAIISGSEVSFLTIQKKFSEEMDESNERKKVRITQLLEKPDQLQASISIVYHSINIMIALLAIYLLNRFFFSNAADGLEGFLLPIAIIVCVIAFFVDILPKMYASMRPIRFSENYAPLIRFVCFLVNPVAKLLVNISPTFSRSIVQQRNEITVEDLSKALDLTTSDMQLEHGTDMLQGIIRFKDKKVSDIFISRAHMVAIDNQMPFLKMIDFIVDAGFSRIPVFEDNHDKIKGILYIKDLLPHLEKDDSFQWQNLIRPAYFVPASKQIDDLLEEFRDNKNHIAIVVDEYGGTSGLITMEDILEEIVGDISDEYDEELSHHTMANDGSYIFEGKTPLADFIKITGVSKMDFEKIMESADTLAGLMLEVKGDFPKRKENVLFGKYVFQAKEISKRRILEVRYLPPKNEEESANA